MKLIDFDVAGTKTMETVQIYGGKGGLHGPYYCAPEIFKNESSDRSDIWSVGVTLYFLLFGQLPFSGWTFEDSIDIIKRGVYDLDSEKNKHGQSLSLEVRDLIRKMFTMDHH